MRWLAWISVAAWLGAGLHLAARDGAARIEKDAMLSDVNQVARRRGLTWDSGDLGRHVANMERAATELRAAGHERVLLVSRPGTNPFTSVAVHVLFPTHVLIRMREGRGLQEFLEEARREGAGALLYLGPDGDWTSMPVPPVSPGLSSSPDTGELEPTDPPPHEAER